MSNWSSLRVRDKMIAGLGLLAMAGLFYLVDCVCVFVGGAHRDVPFIKSGVFMGWFILDPMMAGIGLLIFIYYGIRLIFVVRNGRS